MDITNINFIESCIHQYLKGKWTRNDVTELFVKFSDYSFGEIKNITSDLSSRNMLYPTINKIAKYVSLSIEKKELILKPIRYHIRIDGMNKKERIIGVQEPLHQIFEYVAVEGMRELFDAKIGVFQCASLPGKGQSYGKKYVEKWIKEKDSIYDVKGDIEQCFPSISHARLKELLSRDVKNNKILWLAFELIDMFGMAYTLKTLNGSYRFVEERDKGISIGSYLSQYLSNYFLSYAYHYACSESMFKIRRTKRKGIVSVRLINHVMFYMDDFLLTGSNKKYLKMAMKRIIKFFKDFLGLVVKPKWKICKISNTEPIDMMGFVFRKHWTIIREKIFLKTRRQFLRANKFIKEGLEIPIFLARQCISGYGWYKNTDSRNIRQRLGIDEIHKMCKKTVSFYSRLERSGLDAVII